MRRQCCASATPPHPPPLAPCAQAGPHVEDRSFPAANVSIPARLVIRNVQHEACMSRDRQPNELDEQRTCATVCGEMCESAPLGAMAWAVAAPPSELHVKTTLAQGIGRIHGQYLYRK